MKLFRRTLKVTVIEQRSGFIGSNPSFFETVGNAVEITGLRIQFEIKKSLGKEPNKCLIRITNLSRQSRDALERKPLQVMIHAGYDGVLRLMASGDLKRVFSKREGKTEIVTHIQVADGWRAYAHARADGKSYRPPTTPLQIVKDLLATMNLKAPPEILSAPELRQTLSSGVSLEGPTRDALTRVLAPYGYSWSIQNGQPVVLRDGQTRVGQEFVIDADAGLLASPEETEPDKPKGKSETKFITVLYPELAPGCVVRLNGEFVRQRLKLTDVTHKGDTHTEDMQSECSGKALT